MLCAGCGHEATALKTVRWLNGDRGHGRHWACCDPCWAEVRDAVWIIPGPIICFGTCHQCGEWVSVRDLRDAKPGGRRSAPAGRCRGCAEV